MQILAIINAPKDIDAIDKVRRSNILSFLRGISSSKLLISKHRQLGDNFNLKLIGNINTLNILEPNCVNVSPEPNEDVELVQRYLSD